MGSVYHEGMTDSTTAGLRDVALVDIFNVRDLGGYRTRDGPELRWRQVFRGAGLHRLAGQDLDVVRKLGLRTIIDLRTRGEVRAGGGVPADQLTAGVVQLPMLRRTWRLEDLDPDEPPEHFLVPRYGAMLEEGAESIAETVRLLGDPANLPVIFFCAAGKDRTGVLAAVLLAALGVAAADTVADYHLSKEPLERIRARAQQRASGDPDFPTSAMTTQPPSYMQAPPAAMEQLLDLVDERYGGMPAYLRSIGVTDDDLASLADTLLAAAPAST